MVLGGGGDGAAGRAGGASAAGGVDESPDGEGDCAIECRCRFGGRLGLSAAPSLSGHNNAQWFDRWCRTGYFQKETNGISSESESVASTTRGAARRSGHLLRRSVHRQQLKQLYKVYTVRDDTTRQHPIGGIFILYTPWGGRIRFAFRR
jgi:hypothetical protein